MVRFQTPYAVLCALNAVCRALFSALYFALSTPCSVQAVSARREAAAAEDAAEARLEAVLHALEQE